MIIINESVYKHNDSRYDDDDDDDDVNKKFDRSII